MTNGEETQKNEPKLNDAESLAWYEESDLTNIASWANNRRFQDLRRKIILSSSSRDIKNLEKILSENRGKGVRGATEIERHMAHRIYNSGVLLLKLGEETGEKEWVSVGKEMYRFYGDVYREYGAYSHAAFAYLRIGLIDLKECEEMQKRDRLKTEKEINYDYVFDRAKEFLDIVKNTSLWTIDYRSLFYEIEEEIKNDK